MTQISRRTALKVAASSIATVTLARVASALPANASAKRVLFLGGTGFLGPHMVRSAMDRGYQITLFTRGRAGTELFPEAERLIGDRTGDISALKGKTWDVVIDNSGYVPKDVRASAELLKGSVGHYVFTSTGDAYRDYLAPDIDETYPLAQLPEGAPHNPSRYYGPLKALCEKEVETVFPQAYTIVRPGWVVGPGDTNHLFTYWVMRVHRGGELLAPGTPSDPVQMIDARDLGAFVVDVADRRVVGHFTTVTVPQTFESMLNQIAAGIGATIAPVWVDADFLATKRVRPYFDMPLWWPPRNDYVVPNMPSGLGGGVGAFRMNGARARAAGLKHRAVGVSAKDTLDWYLKEHGTWPETGRPGLTIAREREILDAWKRERKG
jgi:2'-hydroxyisoflavone reductase